MALVNPADLASVTKADIGGIVRASGGNVYRIVGCPLRNEGSPNYWQPINDSTHSPQFIDSVTTGVTGITIDYTSAGGGNGTKPVVAMVVAPDETLAQAGVICGASVGATSAIIKMSAVWPTYQAYCRYDGTNWVATGDAFTFSWATGSQTLIVTNPGSGYSPIAPTAVRSTAQLTRRGVGSARVVISDTSGAGATTTTLEFEDASGTKLTAPDTSMKFFLQRPGGLYPLNPQAVDTTAFPLSNLWVLGLIRIT